MTKQPAAPNPSQLSSAAGLQRYSWHKLGDAPWFGSVIVDDLEWEIEELATSWRATSVTSQSMTAPGLEQLLAKLTR